MIFIAVVEPENLDRQLATFRAFSSLIFFFVLLFFPLLSSLLIEKHIVVEDFKETLPVRSVDPSAILRSDLNFRPKRTC